LFGSTEEEARCGDGILRRGGEVNLIYFVDKVTLTFIF
jgi:hypothetical protein